MAWYWWIIVVVAVTIIAAPVALRFRNKPYSDYLRLRRDEPNLAEVLYLPFEPGDDGTHSRDQVSESVREFCREAGNSPWRLVHAPFNGITLIYGGNGPDEKAKAREFVRTSKNSWRVRDWSASDLDSAVREAESHLPVVIQNCRKCGRPDDYPTRLRSSAHVFTCGRCNYAELSR